MCTGLIYDRSGLVVNQTAQRKEVMILATSKKAENVSWYALMIQTVSGGSKSNCDEIVGMAGNRAELLNASRNCARVNMVRRAILRDVEASERSGLRFPGSGGVSLTCSSNTSVSIVFVTINATSLLLGVALENRGVGTSGLRRDCREWRRCQKVTRPSTSWTKSSCGSLEYLKTPSWQRQGQA